MSTESKGTIIYVGPFSFPNGGAAARRILGVCQSLILSDYKVVVACGQLPSYGVEPNKYKGIEVVSLAERTAENYPSLIKYMFYLTMGRRTVEWLSRLEEKPKAVILYSGYSPYMMRLIRWSNKTKIPLIFDAVEWYDPPNMLKGLVNPYYWNIELAMRLLSPKFENMISISSYLHNHYLKKGCASLQMPPTLDVQEVSPNFNVAAATDGLISIAYTGTPGHKDLFDNVIEGLLRADPSGSVFRLKIAGITREELLKYPAIKRRGFTQLPRFISTRGIVKQLDALELVKRSDFTILLRPHKRYAEAGFPTKMVESFSVGTPIIANITSDIGSYLKDGVSGIVCEGYDVNSLIDALNRIKKLTHNNMSQMRLNARSIALENFDVEVYSNNLDRFVSQIVPLG